MVTKNGIVGIVIAVLVATSGVAVGLHLVGVQPFQEEPTYYDKVEAYGNLTYGSENFRTYVAMSVVGGGLHIELDNGTVVHPHNIRDEVLTRAYWIEEANGSVGDWPPENRYKPWHQRALARTVMNIIGLVMMVVVIGVILVYPAVGPRP